MSQQRGLVKSERRTHVQVGEVSLLFRPFSRSELRNIIELHNQGPIENFEAITAACRATCSDPMALDRVLEDHPFLFAGKEVLLPLLKAAEAEQQDLFRKGAELHKKSERNRSTAAQNLMAFKAYQGGDWEPEAFAGALALVDWAAYTGGVFHLFNNLMKGLSSRKR